MRHQRKLKSPSQQRGVVLFVALILLLILSLLGVTAARMQTTEERMARNEDNRQIGAQAAEAALRAAETGLTTGVYAASQFSANTNGLYELNPTAGSVSGVRRALAWTARGSGNHLFADRSPEPDAGTDLAAGRGAIAQIHHRESAGGRHARRQHRSGAVCSTRPRRSRCIASPPTARAPIHPPPRSYRAFSASPPGLEDTVMNMQRMKRDLAANRDRRRNRDRGGLAVRIRPRRGAADGTHLASADDGRNSGTSANSAGSGQFGVHGRHPERRHPHGCGRCRDRLLGAVHIRARR